MAAPHGVPTDVARHGAVDPRAGHRGVAALRLAGLLLAAVAALVVLHRLGDLPWLRVGWDDVPGWLATVPAEDAVAAALRLVALAAAYWLAATTAAYTLARAARLPAAARAVGWATLPAARRLADRAVAVALAGTLAAPGAPALAAGSHDVALPPAVAGPAALPGDGASLAPPEPAFTAVPGLAGADPTPPPRPAAGGPPEPPHRAPAAGRPGRAPEPAVHVVAPGDSLWSIAVADVGPEAPAGAVDARWRQLVEANRDRLRSGDPDLVYPGERIVLPPR